MRPEEYRGLVAEAAGGEPFRVLPDLDEGDEIEVDWPLDSFRCDPFSCEKVCCTAMDEGEGISLVVEDLLRLAAGGLLDSVEGRFSSSEEAAAFIEDFQNQPFPSFPRLRTVEGHCLHYDPRTRSCGIYEHRPLLCRTFPYAVVHDRERGITRATFTGDCSVRFGHERASAYRVKREAAGEDVAVPKSAADSDELPLWHEWRRVPLRDLSDYDRRHIESCVDNTNEQMRTLYLMARRPEMLAELGLEAFMDEPQSGSPTASAGPS